MIKKKIDINKLACVEYHGSSGITEHCLDALTTLLQFGKPISEAKLLSSEPDSSECRDHALLFKLKDGRRIVINSGFRSGYSGEGAKGLSAAVQLLNRHDIQIEHYEVSATLMNRVEKCCLLEADLEEMLSKPIYGGHYYDYIWYNHEKNEKSFDEQAISSFYQPKIPLALVDHRLLDLAIKFEENPDSVLMDGYRRLEDIVRNKHPDLEGLSAGKLFSSAFLSEAAVLYWPNLEGSEVIGRANLFIGTYMSFRNNRAHKQPDFNIHADIREFLLLNELYILESSSHLRDIN